MTTQRIKKPVIKRALIIYKYFISCILNAINTSAKVNLAFDNNKYLHHPLQPQHQGLFFVVYLKSSLNKKTLYAWYLFQINMRDIHHDMSSDLYKALIALYEKNHRYLIGETKTHMKHEIYLLS